MNNVTLAVLVIVTASVMLGSHSLADAAISDGTVDSFQKIPDTGVFEGILGSSDQFGNSASAIGDLDGDGVEDLVVGADGDDDGQANLGAFYVFFLNTDGTVKSFQKISATEGGLNGVGINGDFGASVTKVGDLNNDGVPDLAVGAQNDNGGAAWILFLNKISVPVGGQIIPVDSSALLLVGTYSISAWLIPAIVAAFGIGIVIARKF